MIKGQKVLNLCVGKSIETQFCLFVCFAGRSIIQYHLYGVVLISRMFGLGLGSYPESLSMLS